MMKNFNFLVKLSRKLFAVRLFVFLSENGKMNREQ